MSSHLFTDGGDRGELFFGRGGVGGENFFRYCWDEGVGGDSQILTGFGFQKQTTLQNSWSCFCLHLFTENVQKS